MKGLILVGISCSGKSTLAKELEQEGWLDVNRDTIRFNEILPGSNWSTYRFTKKREREVTEIQKQMAIDAADIHRNVVISDTNLNPKTRDMWSDFLEELGYDVEVRVMHVEFEEAVKRDRLRYNGVGEEVIYKQYQKYLEYIGRKTYTPNPDLPRCVVVDIDGTLADMTGVRGPFEWGAVGKDNPRQIVIDMVQGLKDSGLDVIVVSGRDGCCYEDTKRWLYEHQVPYDALFMRDAGDMRKDYVVKEEIFWDLIEPYWNVCSVIDDRPCVIRKVWLELKIPNVICVGNPWIDF